MSVDWHQQWELFAQNFYDGKAHIPIGKKTLLLTPGPGFGDLSHPTTQLMIELMRNRIRKQSIIDIGCGSGILTLAALLMGAKSAVGIDIDLDALKHARKNAKLNKLKARFTKTIPKAPHSIFLMNMILSEQRSIQPEQFKPSLWIISGILATQKKAYLKEAKTWGWEPILIKNKSGWAGFVFKAFRND